MYKCALLGSLALVLLHGSGVRLGAARSDDPGVPVAGQLLDPAFGQPSPVGAPNAGQLVIPPPLVLHRVANVGRWLSGEDQTTRQGDRRSRCRSPLCGLLGRPWRGWRPRPLQMQGRCPGGLLALPAGRLRRVDLPRPLPERLNRRGERRPVLLPDPEVHLHQAKRGPALP